MDDLFTAARQVEEACRANRFTFCFIGGIAVIRWGAPRVTRDLDVSVLAGFGGEEPVVRGLLARFAPRLRDAEEFARENRVLLLRTDQGIEIDVSLAALPFEEEMFRRATAYEPVRGVGLTTCSAEDLVVMKAFAARPRDWSDVESIIERQKVLDWSHVLQALTPLAELKPEVEILATLDALRQAKKSG
jgi:hypothetical protein